MKTMAVKTQLMDTKTCAHKVCDLQFPEEKDYLENLVFLISMNISCLF